MYVVIRRPHGQPPEGKALSVQIESEEVGNQYKCLFVTTRLRL